jgi:hypothetical protein
MTKEQKKKLIRQWLKTYKTLMHMTLWKIYPNWEAPEADGDEPKQCEMTKSPKNFNAYLDIDLDSLDDEDDIKQLCRHELTHLLLARYDRFIEFYVPRIDPEEYSIIQEQTAEHVERIIEDLLDKIDELSKETK